MRSEISTKKMAGSRSGPVAALVTLAAVAGLGAAAPGALAANYEGRTTQGKDFSLRTDNAGAPERASYEWDQDCSGGASLTNGGTVSRFPKAGLGKFGSKGTYEAPIEKKFEGEFRVRIDGERLSDTRFKGSFKIKAKVFEKKSGEVLTRCSTGVVRWTADLQGQPAPAPRSLPAGDLHRR